MLAITLGLKSCRALAIPDRHKRFSNKLTNRVIDFTAYSMGSPYTNESRDGGWNIPWRLYQVGFHRIDEKPFTTSCTRANSVFRRVCENVRYFSSFQRAAGSRPRQRLFHFGPDELMRKASYVRSVRWKLKRARNAPLVKSKQRSIKLSRSTFTSALRDQQPV